MLTRFGPSRLACAIMTALDLPAATAASWPCEIALRSNDSSACSASFELVCAIAVCVCRIDVRWSTFRRLSSPATLTNCVSHTLSVARLSRPASRRRARRACSSGCPGSTVVIFVIRPSDAWLSDETPKSTVPACRICAALGCQRNPSRRPTESPSRPRSTTVASGPVVSVYWSPEGATFSS